MPRGWALLIVAVLIASSAHAAKRKQAPPDAPTPVDAAHVVQTIAIPAAERVREPIAGDVFTAAVGPYNAPATTPAPPLDLPTACAPVVESLLWPALDITPPTPHTLDIAAFMLPALGVLTCGAALIIVRRKRR